MTESLDGLSQQTRDAPGTLQVQIYQRLKRSLMRAEFAPSQSISLRDVASAYGVSTQPVRGAIQSLIADGALHFTSSRTVSVPAMTRKRLADLKRVRMNVEGMAAEWAAENITDEEIDQLRILEKNFINSYEIENIGERLSEHLAATQEFRFTIYRASRSDIMVGIIEGLWLRMAPCFNMLRNDHHQVAEQARRYRAIVVHALELRDGRSARAAIEGEIERTSDSLIARLRAD